MLLLRSQATADYFGAVPGAQAGAYDRTVDDWEARLARLGHAVTRVDDAGLAAGLGSDAPAAPLVAPSAAALSDAAVAGLTAAVAGGRGLVACWQLAVHRDDAGWRGFDVLRRLAGAVPLPDAERPEPAALRWVTLHVGAAVTAGLPAGARLEVQPFDPPLPLAAPGAVADFTRWELLPFGPWARPVRPTAAAQARYGRGRVVWLNFEPRALVPGGHGAAWLDALVANAVAWAGGRPLAAVEPWPGGARVAAMLGLDSEHRFALAGPTAERFRAAGVPVTAFAVSSLAQAEPAVVAQLARAGEVGSHTDDHRPLAGRPPAEQVEQLARSRTLLSAMAGVPVVGLRPPEEQTDDATFEALATAGYEYVAGTVDKDRAEPDVRATPAGTIVRLPRVPLDDYEFTIRTPTTDPAVVTAAVARDLDQVRRLGGLFFFDVHTQLVEDPALAGALRLVLGLRDVPDVWPATGRTIAAWWRARAGVHATVAAEADGTVAVEVASGAAVERAAVRVHLPPGADAPVDAAGAPGVAVHPVADGTVQIVVAALAAGERRRIVLRPAVR